MSDSTSHEKSFLSSIQFSRNCLQVLTFYRWSWNGCNCKYFLLDYYIRTSMHTYFPSNKKILRDYFNNTKQIQNSY